MWQYKAELTLNELKSVSILFPSYALPFCMRKRHPKMSITGSVILSCYSWFLYGTAFAWSLFSSCEGQASFTLKGKRPSMCPSKQFAQLVEHCDKVLSLILGCCYEFVFHNSSCFISTSWRVPCVNNLFSSQCNNLKPLLPIAERLCSKENVCDYVRIYLFFWECFWHICVGSLACLILLDVFQSFNLNKSYNFKLYLCFLIYNIRVILALVQWLDDAVGQRI